TSVMKPWPLELLLLLLEDEEPVPPVPEDAPDVDPVDAADVPPPDTVWPTTPLIAATVPVAGAVSAVPSSFCWAVATDASADVTAASADARSPGCGGAPFSASLASDARCAFCADVSDASEESSVCWSRARPCTCAVCALERAI